MFVSIWWVCVDENVCGLEKRLWEKRKEKEEEANVKGKFTEPSGKKKVKCCGCCSHCESLNVCLITKMSLETEFWKLKILKMCIQFP